MTIITIYALFFDDIRVLLFPQDADPVFYAITLFGLICFTIEIILASYAKEDYLLSFFFWLDIVSTLSMVPDIGWIWAPLIGGADRSADATDLAKTSRAGRVTRVIRVIRLIRLIRIVKLYKQAQHVQKKQNEYALKIQTLQNIDRTEQSGLQNLRRTSTLRGLKEDGEAAEPRKTNKRLSSSVKDPKPPAAAQAGAPPAKGFGLARAHTLAPGAFQGNAAMLDDDAELSEEDSGPEEALDEMFEEDDEDDTAQIPEESKISKILSDQTTKTVIILVLCLLFCLPAFTVETYLDDTVTLHDRAVRHLGAIYDYGPDSWSDYRIAFDHLVDATRGEDQIYPLILLKAADPNQTTWGDKAYVKQWEPAVDTLRPDEFRSATYEAKDGFEFIVAYSTRAALKAESIINIARTLFIVVILALGSILFT